MNKSQRYDEILPEGVDRLLTEQEQEDIEEKIKAVLQPDNVAGKVYLQVRVWANTMVKLEAYMHCYNTRTDISSIATMTYTTPEAVKDLVPDLLRDLNREADRLAQVALEDLMAAKLNIGMAMTHYNVAESENSDK